MSRYPKPIILSLIVSLLIVGASSAAPDATDILKKSYAAESRNTFSGQLKTTIHGSAGCASATVNVFRSDGRSRLEYVTGPLAGTAIVDDGVFVIRLDPSAELAHISRTPKAPERLDLLLANYRPILIGSDRIANRNCYELRLEPRYAGNPSKKLWIDKESLVVLKTERYGSDGKIVMSTEYTRIDYSARPSSSIFAIPHGWKSSRPALEPNASPDAVRKAVGFTPVKPGYVPKGYSFDGYYICSACGVTCTAGLRYTNGLNTLSIFEGRGACPGAGVRRGWGRNRGGGRSARHGAPCGSGACVLAGTPQARMLRTTVGDLTVTIVGDIAEVELRRMAASFK